MDEQIQLIEIAKLITSPYQSLFSGTDQIVPAACIGAVFLPTHPRKICNL